MQDRKSSERKRGDGPRALAPWLITAMVLVAVFCVLRNLAPDIPSRSTVEADAGTLGRLCGGVAVAVVAWIVLYSAAIRRLDRSMSSACLGALIVIALVSSVAGMALRAMLA